MRRKNRTQYLSVRDFRHQCVKFYSSYYTYSRLEYLITLNLFVLSLLIYSYRKNMRAPKARAKNFTFRCLNSALENALEKVKVRLLRKSVREKKTPFLLNTYFLRMSDFEKQCMLMACFDLYHCGLLKIGKICIFFLSREVRPDTKYTGRRRPTAF